MLPLMSTATMSSSGTFSDAKCEIVCRRPSSNTWNADFGSPDDEVPLAVDHRDGDLHDVHVDLLGEAEAPGPHRAARRGRRPPGSRRRGSGAPARRRPRPSRTRTAAPWSVQISRPSTKKTTLAAARRPDRRGAQDRRRAAQVGVGRGRHDLDRRRGRRRLPRGRARRAGATAASEARRRGTRSTATLAQRPGASSGSEGAVGGDGRDVVFDALAADRPARRGRA